MTQTRALRLLAEMLAPSRRSLVLAVVLSAGQALAILPIALLVRDVFGHRIPDGEAGGIVLDGLAVLGLYLVATGLGAVSQRIVATAASELGCRLRLAALRRLHELPLDWFDGRRASELHAQIVPEADRVEDMARAVLGLTQSAVVALPLLVFAVVLSPLLTGMLVVLVPVLLLAARLATSILRGRVRTWRAAWLGYSEHVDLMLRTMTLVRARAADAHEVETAVDCTRTLADAAHQRARAQSVSGAVHGSVNSLAGVGVLIVGGVAVTRHALSLGDLLAFYAAAGLLLRQSAGASVATLQIAGGIESLSTLTAILDDPSPPPYVGRTQRPFDGGVSFERVSFGYGRRTVLDGVDLDVRPGEHVALVGPNGAGKSTVIALILGLYRPWDGCVRAGGFAYDDLDLDLLRRQIGYVPQSPLMRPGSIGENVGYGRPDAGRDELERAVGLAGLGPFVAELPAGLDTPVGDNGLRLSGGQAQRVAIARALVGAPRLLLLDEPTNHLDGDAVADVLAAVRALRPSPTVLTITHDRELAGRADRTLVLAAASGREAAPAGDRERVGSGRPVHR
jgi:ABC-type multidrug transport system fused ATPase/permease subunit